MNSLSFSLSSPLTARALLLVSLLLAAGCSTPTKPAASTPAPAPRSPVGAYNDDPRALTANEAAVIAAGLDPAKLGGLEQTLLATMLQPGAKPEARQDAAHKLGLVLNPDHADVLAVLAPLLTDNARVDEARLALDRVPGPQVDALYLNALPAATGRARLGLIDSIGTRRITAAVPALAGLLNDGDPATAAATARALGEIGGNAALASLGNATDPLAPKVLNARLAAAAKVDKATLGRTAGDIFRNPAAPLAQRSAALRQLIDAMPAGAVAEIHTALLGTEPAFHASAIESVATVPASAALADRLDGYTPAVQVPLIAALGSRGDAAAVPSLLKALDSSDAEVRLAAINALGRLPGNPTAAHRLATLATGKNDEAKEAIASLSRLHGSGLDEFIRTEAASGEATLQPVYIQQLGARNQTEAIPFLLSLRSSPTESLRLEALDALRAIATAAEQPALIAWALGTDSKAEQTRAVRALITIILRDASVTNRAETVIAAIKAGDAPARLVLLPVLGRIAGPSALASAEMLARDANEAVSAAATAELTRWPDASALPILIGLAGTTPQPTVRTTAAEGATRFLAVRKNTTPTERSQYTRQLLALPLDSSIRVSLLNVLSLCADQEALASAQQLLTDPATAPAAQDAVDCIRSNLAGAPAFTASAASDMIPLLTDGKSDTFWSVPNAPGGWLRADLHHSRPIRKITLDQGRKAWDWPEQIEVWVGDNPEKSGEPLVKLEGERGQTVITLPAGTRGRYVWLLQQGTRVSNSWTVGEFLLE